MRLESTSIQNGYFADRFGHRGTEFVQGKMPSRSFQISWHDLPSKTQSLALIFIDHEAVPVCGFPWIHWVACNIPASWKELPENASIEKKGEFTQGVNSWASPILPSDWKLSLSHEDASAFGGSAPPDKTHRYQVHVYALDIFLNLKPGFYESELLSAMEGHILAEAKLSGLYKSKNEK